ncbi:protein disulfide oxidoreductase [Enterobacteriaceae bacterium H11S18]|uniref:protein disulfide oxidoreductase n=1 Tax=Dryocola clanedunensis TaxID=2925396 RepID=UPI0022EFDF36|nr:protein disulfide oxidoreductase [Dryocola clanedunensis]MCT4712230.1 protein disulfide oxidoreductase [Dryocola clanedunensis]
MANRLLRWGRDGLVLLALLGAVLLVMDWWRAPQLPSAFDSTPLHTLDGNTLSLAAMSQERPLLIYFWASWCGVCRFTTPDVARLTAEGENVATVALRSGDKQKVASWLARKQVSFPVINDADGRLSQNWQIGVTPTFVVLYKGEIVSSTTGWTSYWGMKTRLWWARLS